MRLFTALPLPDALRRELGALTAGCEGLRPLPLEQLHVTLVFIGEVNPRDLSPIEEALAGLEIPPLSLHCEALFDSGRGALGLQLRPDPALQRLQKQMRARLGEVAGVRLEQRPYKPHLTLARYPQHPPAQLGPLLARLQGQSYPWSCDRFGLYSSQLRAEGALHRLEAEFIRPPSLRPRRRPPPATST